MDVFLRGVETTLMVFALLLGAAALVTSAVTPLARAATPSVTLPMLAVVADETPPPAR